MKKVLLSLTSILFLIISSSCSKSSSDVIDKPTTSSLPITIDFHQVVGAKTQDGGISYVQDGLTIETLENSSYSVEEVNKLWLYSGKLKISNINALDKEKLHEITVKWKDNNSSAVVTLYDSADTVIEMQTNRYIDSAGNNVYVPEGEYSFNNLENVSYLIISGGETIFSFIKFKD